jgi:hypothetical protein
MTRVRTSVRKKRYFLAVVVAVIGVVVMTTQLPILISSSDIEPLSSTPLDVISGLKEGEQIGRGVIIGLFLERLKISPHRIRQRTKELTFFRSLL